MADSKPPRGAERLTPSTEVRKLAAVRSFFAVLPADKSRTANDRSHAYTLQSPRATVVKPYEVLTPAEQVRVLNVLHDRLRDRVLAALALSAGLRASELTGATVGAEIDESSERMQAKIRRAQLQKIPYMLVVGDKEAEAGAVAVRLRSGEDLKAKPLAEFVALAKEAVANKE